jgi:holo-[acyl-carrier protein] synthase
MIAGVGIDVVSIERIERAMRRKRFLERLLTPAETAEAKGPAWVAGRWAAKEAVMKALGRPVPFLEIEILRGAKGAPSALVASRPDQVIHVSISHDQGMAVAVAVVERPAG